MESMSWYSHIHVTTSNVLPLPTARFALPIAYCQHVAYCHCIDAPVSHATCVFDERRTAWGCAGEESFASCVTSNFSSFIRWKSWRREGPSESDPSLRPAATGSNGLQRGWM